MKHLLATALCVAPVIAADLPASGAAAPVVRGSRPPNILLITVDDMNWDTPGCFGGPAGVTPHIDRLAAEGLRFERAHVALAICQPSRQALMTGRYPHNAGYR
jgi:N-sulfoglucosamine sulfohydrolase